MKNKKTNKRNNVEVAEEKMVDFLKEDDNIEIDDFNNFLEGNKSKVTRLNTDLNRKEIDQRTRENQLK